jgi:hypothetical protein
MLKEPIISGNFKGMAVIQIFRNNSINTCTSISMWIQTDQELMDSMMLTSKVSKYIETESDGNVIKLYDDKKEQVINTYTFNTKHGIYLNSKFSGSVECLNLVDYIDESEEVEQPIDIFDFIDFVERLSEKNERKSISRSSFTSVISSNGEDDSIDGIFIFRDIVY